MHKAILSALAGAAMVCSALATTTTTTPKKKHHATANTSASARKRKHPGVATKTSAAQGTTTTATAVAGRRKGKKSRGPTRNYQQAPSTDRYREIQQALASKGYFQGEANGEWGADSSDALKRFQASQNLTSDGKINSLSLIALGLGPKHLTASSNPAPHQPAAPAPPATVLPSPAPAPVAPPQ